MNESMIMKVWVKDKRVRKGLGPVRKRVLKEGVFQVGQLGLGQIRRGSKSSTVRR